MNKLITLMRREFWENRGAIFITPLVVAGLMILFFIMGFAIQWVHDANDWTFRESVRWIAQLNAAERGHYLTETMIGFSTIFTMVMMVVGFFYLLGVLYDDRKDKSILFWKSLPASDFITILSKLLTVMVTIPLIFWAAYIIASIVVGIIGSIMVLIVNQNPWTIFWSPAEPLTAWFKVLISYLGSSLWFLPIFAWLILVSAFSPRLPLLFAILPVLGISILQSWFGFIRSFSLSPFGGNTLIEQIGSYFMKSPLIMSFEVDERTPEAALGVPINSGFDHAVTIGNILDRLTSLPFAKGLLLAAVMLTAAWWLRRRAADG